MFLILICIYAFSNISGKWDSFVKAFSFSWSSIWFLGAHFNPAVTFATLLTQRVTFLRFGAYLIAQLLGSLAGSGNQRTHLSRLSVLAIRKKVLTICFLGKGLAAAVPSWCFFLLLICFMLLALLLTLLFLLHLALIATFLLASAFVSGGALNPLRALGPAGMYTKKKLKKITGYILI